MGGAKNHGIVMPDADLDQVVSDLTGAAFGSAGERCMALPVVVPVGEDTAQRLRDKLVPAIEALRVGVSTDPDAHYGPVVTQAHKEKVEGWIAKCADEGAEQGVEDAAVYLCQPRADGKGGFRLRAGGRRRGDGRRRHDGGAEKERAFLVQGKPDGVVGPAAGLEAVARGAAWVGRIGAARDGDDRPAAGRACRKIAVVRAAHDDGRHAVVPECGKHRRLGPVDVGGGGDGGDIDQRLGLAPFGIERTFVNGESGQRHRHRRKKRRHDGEVCRPVAGEATA